MKKQTESLIWLFAGTILMLFSNGRWIFPLATWVYPICFLLYTHGNKKFPALLYLFICSGLVNAIAWWKMVPLPLPIYFVVMTLIINLFMTLPFFIDRIYRSRFHGFMRTFIFPVSWVSLEFLHNNLIPKGSWLSIAYSQFDFLTLLQITAITGVYGITFLIGWFASATIYVVEEKFAWKKIRTGVGIFGGVLGIAILAGFIRIHSGTDQKMVRTAAIVQARKINAELNSCKWTDSKAISTYSTEVEENLLSKSREAARNGARIILWQESAGLLPRSEESGFINRAKILAAEEKIYLLMTLWSVPENYPSQLVENKLILVDPQGNIQFTYLKSNPAPPEPIVKGGGTLPVFETEFGKLSAAICFDADFPGFIRQAGKNKTDIMFIPANDWKEIDPIHSHMAIARAIENGFALVHPAGQGLSIIADNKGRVLSSLDYYSSDDQILYANVSVKGTRTIYAQVGDVFAILNIAAFFFFTVFAFAKKSEKIWHYNNVGGEKASALSGG